MNMNENLVYCPLKIYKLNNRQSCASLVKFLNWGYITKLLAS